MKIFETFKIIWYFAKNYKLYGLFVLGLIGLTGFLDALNLAALYPIMHNGLHLESEGSSRFFNIIHTLSTSFGKENPLATACIFLLVISIIAIAMRVLYYYASNKLTLKLSREIKRQVIEKLVSADYDFYARNKQGKLIHTAAVAPEYASTIVLAIVRLFFNIISAAFLFALLIILSWQATAALVVMGAIYGMFIKRVVEKIIYRSAEAAIGADREKNVILNELITGIKPIRIFRVLGYWKKRYLEQVDIALTNRFRVLMSRVYPENSMKFMFFFTVGVAGFYLSQRPPQEVVALLPIFGTFVVVANRAFPAIQNIGSSFITIVECFPNIKLVYDLCIQEIENIPNGTKSLDYFNEHITFEDVEFRYRQGHDLVLKKCSFQIPKNKMTAIAGSSGSGKTTIVSLLLKLYQPQKGKIAIDGVDIFDYTHSSYLSKIGYVGQEAFLFNTTIRENICFGLKDCTDEMIEEAAKQANAHEFIIETKDKYDTVVGDSGIILSGGQKQRIAIARAILRKPEIIVLDEATSSLDTISERKVQEAINRISKNTTLVVIAHRLSTIQTADNIILLENGQIKEQGTHEDLLENKDLYYKFHSIIEEESMESQVVSETP